jgi:hypothetical protein
VFSVSVEEGQKKQKNKMDKVENDPPILSMGIGLIRREKKGVDPFSKVT